MRVLVACEESQEVTKALRASGVEAYSCDLQEPSGGHPEWHIQGDALEEAYSGKYGAVIAFPPCTYMSRAGARWMYPSKGVVCPDRLSRAMEAKEFFLSFLNSPVDYIAVENPTPLKVVGLPPFTQAIHPYHFGEPYSKRTLLWLKNLPPLEHTDVVEEHIPWVRSNTGGKKRGHVYNRGISSGGKSASKTFPGVAKAMAEQWGHLFV